MKSANRTAPRPAAADYPVEMAEPLKPRRGLFWSLAAVTLVWVICLFLMYWFTVRPERGAVPVDAAYLQSTNPR